MKKILSTLVVLNFTIVAGVSAVACNTVNSNSKEVSMNDQVLADLGIYDEKGNSQVEAKLNVQNDDTVTWTTDKLRNLTALNLLTNENNAQSKESFDFLTDVLKLKTKGDGNWNTKTFEKDKVDAISLTIISVDPVLKVIDGDYAVSEGTVTVQWKENNNNLGNQYFIKLKSDETKGVVKESLPASEDLTLKDFNRIKSKSCLVFFNTGFSKNTIPIDSDITNSLKRDTEIAKKLFAIAEKIAQPLKIIVTQVNTRFQDLFDFSDTLTIKISLGPVHFNTKYTLTLD